MGAKTGTPKLTLAPTLFSGAKLAEIKERHNSKDPASRAFEDIRFLLIGIEEVQKEIGQLSRDLRISREVQIKLDKKYRAHKTARKELALQLKEARKI